MWNDAVVTNGGKELLAEWFNGGILNISDAATGTGTVAASLLMGQTQLVDRKQKLSIIKTEKVAEGMRLQLQLTSTGVASAYTANQIGIWAKLGAGANTLIAIFQDNTGISIPSFAEMPDYVFTFYATIQMSNEGEMTVNVDSTAIVTRSDFNAEHTARVDAEKGLREDYTAKVNTEASTRFAEDIKLSEKIDAETTARETADNTIKADFQSKINAEAVSRDSADADLRQSLNAEAAARESADTDLQNDYVAKITAEANTRKTADDTQSKNLATETTARQKADTDLQKDYDAKINAETSARQTAVSSEATARANADTAIQNSLTSHTNNKNNPHGVSEKQLLDALSTATALADDDLMPFKDTSAGTAMKITKANLKKSLGLNPITAAVVTLGAAQTYSGALKTQAVSSVVLNGTTLTAGTDYVVSGNTATNAGTYTLVITGIGNYTGSIAKTWEIAKAAGSVSFSSSEVSIVGAKYTAKTVTVTGSGDGVVSATSLSPEIATVSTLGDIIIIKGVSTGSAAIRVTKHESENYHATSGSITVPVTIYPSVLNENTWEQIRAASDAGIAASIWSVGATKEILIKGTIGMVNTIDTTEWVYILGFNHNSTHEGSNKIHFGGFKTAQKSGTDIALIDTGYGTSYTDGTLRFNMNHSGATNSGGWKSCDLRYDILGSTKTKGADAVASTATNPVNNTLMAALPSELRAVMKPITKYTDNTGGGTGNIEANVTATVDYLPLLSEYEVQGGCSFANSYERNRQLQYDYYKNGNSKIKYKHSDTGAAVYWWLRSPNYTNSYTFCIVYSSGSGNISGASYCRALAPAFAV